MKSRLFRPLFYVALAALLFAGIGCSSSGGASNTGDFTQIRTGSYIPRRAVKRDTATNEKTKVAKAKRQKPERKSKEAPATKPADDDYVTRGGFR